MADTSSFILLVEDVPQQRRILSGFLKKSGYEVGEAANATEALHIAGDRHVDLLLTDLRLEGLDGIDILDRIRREQPDLQAIVLTAYGTADDAVRAMKAGAYDFLSKPVDLARLEVLIVKALEKAALSAQNRQLSAMLENSSGFEDMVGSDPHLEKLKEISIRVAASQSSIIITGESGTGKEVLARSIHRLSARRHHPFITINCAALPESLIESELFGHEAGAFTGAVREKKGRFELARGGTLFLDEIGEVPPHVQVKLLNVLQSGQFERVGGTVTLHTDARIIAATHRDLERSISEGSFRSDLYYRLNVVSLKMPALRDRPADIPLLARHFLKQQSDLSGAGPFTISPEAMVALMAYRFPGNVRELENWLERAVVLAETDTLTLEDFPSVLLVPSDNGKTGCTHGTIASQSSAGLEAQVQSLEIHLIREALARHRGNQSAAARDLQLTERNIRYKIRKYGL
jgi:two-component system NtrC family response regulator